MGKSFLMVLVTPGHVQNGAAVRPLLLLKKKGPVRRSQQAVGARNHIKLIIGLLLSGVTNDLLFATYAKQLGLGLEEQLKKFVHRHPGTKLIIIRVEQTVNDWRSALVDVLVKLVHGNRVEVGRVACPFSRKSGRLAGTSTAMPTITRWWAS